ncbi:hypothetical protein OH146_10775 [Salinibacterium sp. SYSU T00001]|uniref:hypothetical protein n=1 Tax=Homoserinimonas sedimenticola TaxID=2986805 RepID=UPI0022369E51|nr:hypothetical protein [Salinibacterium sedimenticola]MCW4386255.1 hypothetical protein [Salinibacterium sedimenticola]
MTSNDANIDSTGNVGGEPSDLGADANPFEQGTGDPTGAGTVETPNVDGGRQEGSPDEVEPAASDPQPNDPIDAARESKETVTNDAVAGETVEGSPAGEEGPGLIEPNAGFSDDENQVDFEAVEGAGDTVATEGEPDPDGGLSRR